MWVDVEQNSEEWFNLRMGKITSSNFDKIMANEGKSFGNPAIEYAQKVALEIVTGNLDETASYSNSYMERGQDLEPIALQEYEAEYLYSVGNGGFNMSEDKRLGDSPDGIVENGCIEIKSVIPKTQWKRIKSNPFDTSYKWQVYGHILIGGYDWCDFISYCPEMPENKRLIVTRIHKDEEMIERLSNRLELFIKEVDKHVQILNS